MTATAAIPGIGATFTWDSDVVLEITSIGGPNLTRDTIEATHLNSTGGWKEFIGGLRDGGEITLEGNFIVGGSAYQTSMLADLYTDTVKAWVITFPTSVTATWTGNGLITAFNPNLDMSDPAKVSMTIKVTGQPTLNVTGYNNLSALSGIEENTGAALTFVPAFSATKYSYAINVNTASTWIKLTPTFAAGTCTITCGSSSQTVLTTIQSTAISVTDAVNNVVTITIQETSKVATVYTLYVGVP